MKILVTGGAGYIGSHTCVELLEAGHEVAVADNLCNASRRSLEAVEQVTGKMPVFFQIDCRDRGALTEAFQRFRPHAVIHFAALKAVGESVERALDYYDNNLGCVTALCGVMREQGVNKLVFSSSATVYGEPQTLPITEDFPLSAANPYGWTKLMSEQILRDLSASDPAWSIVLLRYFNPVGAHPSGLMGEDPRGIPNNLVPYIAQTAVGRLEEVQVYGDDYDTPDGTGVRDYIHVVDLARGHVAALDHMAAGTQTYNLGTGSGTSVLEMIHSFERACGKPIPYRITGRRPGDIAACWADPSRAQRELGWRAGYTVDEMCRDAWHWQSTHPDGFGGGDGL